MSTSRDKLIEAAKKLDCRSQIDGDEFYFKKVYYPLVFFHGGFFVFLILFFPYRNIVAS